MFVGFFWEGIFFERHTLVILRYLVIRSVSSGKREVWGLITPFPIHHHYRHHRHHHQEIPSGA